MKIALCIPVYGDTKAHFTFSLTELVIHSADKTLRPFMVSSSTLPASRTQLAAEALAWRADWLLWLDADHTFPPDGLERLLAHNLPVVGCNYPRRRTGKPAASTPTTKEKIGMVEPVDFLGLGFCLISSAAMKAVPAPQFETRWIGAEFESEDVSFFRKLRGVGFPPHVDHSLSMEVGHIAETVLRFPQS